MKTEKFIDVTVYRYVAQKTEPECMWQSNYGEEPLVLHNVTNVCPFIFLMLATDDRNRVNAKYVYYELLFQ